MVAQRALRVERQKRAGELRVAPGSSLGVDQSAKTVRLITIFWTSDVPS